MRAGHASWTFGTGAEDDSPRVAARRPLGDGARTTGAEPATDVRGYGGYGGLQPPPRARDSATRADSSGFGAPIEVSFPDLREKSAGRNVR